MNKKYPLLYLLLLLITAGCGGAENQRIDTESIKSSPLLVPPCHNPSNLK